MRRRLRLRGVEPAGERRAPGASGWSRSAWCRPSCAAGCRSGTHRESLIEIVCNREDVDRVPADRGDRDRAHRRPRGPLARAARQRRGAAGRALRHARHRFGLTEELERACRRKAFRGLGGLRRAGAPLHQHRTRDRARPQLPGQRRARLPGPEHLAPAGDARDQRAPGDREPQPLPRGHALVPGAGLHVRDRRRGRRATPASRPWPRWAPAT